MVCPFTRSQLCRLFIALILKLSVNTWTILFATSFFIHIPNLGYLFLKVQGSKTALPSSGKVVRGPNFELTLKLIVYLNPLCCAAKTLWGVIWSSDSRVTGMQSKALQHIEELLA